MNQEPLTRIGTPCLIPVEEIWPDSFLGKAAWHFPKRVYLTLDPDPAKTVMAVTHPGAQLHQHCSTTVGTF